MAKRLLIYGNDHRAREVQGALAQSGAATELVYGVSETLSELERTLPDGLIFVLQVYWDGALDLVKRIKAMTGFERMPIFYVGDFIESKNQIFLKELGVKTLTMGPVPPQEISRYIMKELW
ncbi:MAG: hypothetical protein AAB955_01540 [Patescibacteria group bacterium]